MGDILQTLSIYSVLLPFSTGLVLWKFHDANARIMLLLLAFAFIPQIIGSQSHDHKFVFYNLYIVIDVFFWSLLFYRNTSAKFAKKLILALSTTIILFSVFIFYSKGLNKTFYSYLICFDSAIQVVCVLIYFYEKYYNDKIIRLIEDSMFWFCLGILFYAPCTYFIFVYRSVQGQVPNELWLYHDVLNILLYIIITIGFLVRVKSEKINLKWI